MARIDLTIPALGSKLVDLRTTLAGDSFSWSWERPLSQVKYLAIHHTAAPDTQTPQEIANYHIQHNGWGGIGYHFLISKDGIVFYVGDISTARANVSSLNEQVLGICLIGNFVGGQEPTNEQINSTRTLCGFFINSYPALSNVGSWEAVKGHKELLGQATACPGATWETWKQKIIQRPPVANSAPATGDRALSITQLYRIILGRDPDQGGLDTYTASPYSIDQIARALAESTEHQGVVTLARSASNLQNQLGLLQNTVSSQKKDLDTTNMTLSSLNAQVASLRGALQQKQAEIDSLRQQTGSTAAGLPDDGQAQQPPDTTFTLAGALINLFKLLFPRKEA